MAELQTDRGLKDPEDGLHQSHVRCVCPDRANLQARVERGSVTWAGCPVCGREAIVEVLPDGSLGFFPMGVRMF
jgi:hypothetical protein